jgi:hypothetical protein
MRVEERLADLTADLVECEENSVFLERLFSLKAGVWEDVTALCRDIVHLEDHMAQLQRSSKGRLHATWLDYPVSTHGKGYCLIIFFVEELHWSNVALYNKQWFSRKLTRRVRTTNQYRAQRELE